MSNVKDLGATKASIDAKYGVNKTRSLKDVKNLTAENDLHEIVPVGDRIVVSLKSWPSQSASGIFVPDSYTVIRGEKYVTEVVAVGEEVTIVGVGDIVIISMYSGHHITTKTGHAKIIKETDIFTFKAKKDMETPLSYRPETFQPGYNYIMVELDKKKEVFTDGGILVETGDDGAFSQNDVTTKTATVVAIGPVNEYGKQFEAVKVGARVIFDAYVGMALNATTTEDEGRYRVMFTSDVLAFVNKQ
jgi:co-chaperonin GroES (HSP10)